MLLSVEPDVGKRKRMSECFYMFSAVLVCAAGLRAAPQSPAESGCLTREKVTQSGALPVSVFRRLTLRRQMDVSQPSRLKI